MWQDFKIFFSPCYLFSYFGSDCMMKLKSWGTWNSTLGLMLWGTWEVLRCYSVKQVWHWHGVCPRCSVTHSVLDGAPPVSRTCPLDSNPSTTNVCAPWLLLCSSHSFGPMIWFAALFLMLDYCCIHCSSSTKEVANLHQVCLLKTFLCLSFWLRSPYLLLCSV